MTPKLQQLLDSLAARNVQKIRLIEGEKAQVWKDGAWTAATLQVTSELLDALALENGERELQTASANFRAEVETSGESRQITLFNLGATTAQLKATATAPTAATPSAPPPIPTAPRAGGVAAVSAKVASDKISKISDFKVAQSESVRNVGARVGELKSVPLPVAAVPTEPVAPAKQQWFYIEGGEQMGPKARVAMQSLIISGAIKHDTLLWREGLNQWIPANESEFSLSFRGSVATPKSPQPPERQSPHRDSGLSLEQEELERSEKIQGIVAIVVVAIFILLGMVFWQSIKDRGYGKYDSSIQDNDF